MDIDKDVNIYPKFQSPIFTDLRYIISNVTNNISLPITANNARAIELHHLADKKDPISEISSFPRRWHTVRYYRNGMEICHSALGKIINIEDDRINFAFSWGNIENFQQLFDKNLRQLKCNAYLPWNTNTQYETTFDKNYCFYNLDFGVGVTRGVHLGRNDNIPFQHPLVKSNYILAQIATDNGITINNFKNGNFLTEDYFIPCLTKNSNNLCNEYSAYVSMFNIIEVVEIQNISYSDYPDRSAPTSTSKRAFIHPIIFEDTENGEPDFVALTDPVDLWDDVEKCFDVQDVDKVRLIISEFTLVCDTYGQLPYPELTVELGRDIKIKPRERIEIGTTQRYYFDQIDREIDVKDIKMLKIGLGEIKEKSENNKLYTQLPVFLGLMSPQIWLIPYLKELVFSPKKDSSIRFPIAENLPDMTQSDFLHAIMQMNGLFAYAKNEKTIDFLSIDDIVANIPNALDWTDKLVNKSLNYNAPNGIEFEFLDFERQNHFTYDNDSEILKDYGTTLFIDNRTIKDGKDKELVKLPFSPTNSVKRYGEYLGEGRNYSTYYEAVIPCYDSSVGENEVRTVTFNEGVKPRILNFKKKGNNLVISFEGLEWKKLIEKKYRAYKSIIKNPRVLKVDCLLNDVDLSKLDFSLPIKFSQFGGYYIIITVQTAANGLCKCEFLEIKTDFNRGQGLPGRPD